MRRACSSYGDHIWKQGKCRDCGQSRTSHGSVQDGESSDFRNARLATRSDDTDVDPSSDDLRSTTPRAGEKNGIIEDEDEFALVFDRSCQGHPMHSSVLDASSSQDDADIARVNNILEGTVKVRNLLDGTTSVIQDGLDTQQVNLREVVKAQMHEIERLKTDRAKLNETIEKDRTEFVERMETLESSAQGFRRVSGRVIVIGCAHVGKTSLVNRFTNNDFSPTCSTIACDSYQRSVRVDDAMVNLLIYDTAGQERFADLTAQYFRLGDACLLCVDLSVYECIIAGRIEWWRLQASEEELRRAACYANSVKVPFFRTSAKDGFLGSLFYHVAECCLRRRAERKLEEERLLLTARDRQMNRGLCCG
eukprot:GEMP01034645.1.p1 GENE.GEMP01034645.1~~GEMP01034645.1.p1  ORF type:complete len:364 (-),score=90.71 GEMP01034645.1:520-1611(-)